jgi:hypothetical protein
LRITKYDSESAAAAVPALVQQDCTVELAKLACNEQPQSSTASSPRKEWFEDTIHRLRFDARPAIGDFQKGSIAGI